MAATAKSLIGVYLGLLIPEGHIWIDSQAATEADIWQAYLGDATNDAIEQQLESGVELKRFVVSECQDNRSAAQNRLYWTWLTDCSNTSMNTHAGKTKDDWHTYFKREFLCKLYERDDIDYSEMVESLRKVWRKGLRKESEAMWDYVVKETSTTKASIPQFTEYLRDIERWCHYEGICLRTDIPDYLLAMGDK